ncbi:MAG TPA: hypothetical protein VFE62_00970 [Gemmataceae bacterium]|nr:hypothetical protein [Gemmataceae bacterium]
MAATLKPLSEALNGKPSEGKATTIIATHAVIPAALAGIFGGLAFVPTSAGAGMLFALAAGGAVAASLVTVLAIHAIYRAVGFHAVSRIGGAVLGAILGFCALSLAGPRMSWPEWLSSHWLVPPFLGAAIGALAGATLGWFARANPGKTDEAVDPVSTPGEPNAKADAQD